MSETKLTEAEKRAYDFDLLFQGTHRDLVDAQSRIEVMAAALRSARETIHQLYNMRGCEAEGEFSEWVADIDAALSNPESE
jgi:hypothetical protein